MTKVTGLQTVIFDDIAGSLFFAVGIVVFAKNAGFAPGGITGLAILANYLWNIPVGTVTLLLNIPLALLSLKVVGKEFLLKTLTTLVVSTLVMDVGFAQVPTYSRNPLMCAVFSGVFTGIGMACFYMHGSSSGGTDFLTISLRVKFPHLSAGYITMALDVVVIALGWLVFGNFDAVLYGITCSFCTSLVLDKILYGMNSRKLLFIISDNGMRIAKRIGEYTDRGSTEILGTGTYTKQQKSVLLCACSKAQAYEIIREIHQIEPSAFVMITEASEIYGKGFIEK